MSKFTTIYNKGFQMTFGNGFSISVQWGVGNYCEKKDSGQWDEPTKHDYWDSNSAEIAVFGKDGEFITITNYPDVIAGWSDPPETEFEVDTEFFDPEGAFGGGVGGWDSDIFDFEEDEALG